jgi:hypothetical protein
MNRSLSTLSFRSLLITVVLAAPVCAQNLTNFVNGTPANADQVNANFVAVDAKARSAKDTADAVSASVTSLTSTLTVANGKLGIGNNSPAERLNLGSFGSGVDEYLHISVSGGNVRRNGIKLRTFDDNNGFTIDNDERGVSLGLNILRHVNSEAGVSALFIAKDTGNINVPGGNLSVGSPPSQVHRMHIYGTGSSTNNQPHYVAETDGGTFGPQLRLKHGGASGQEWVLLSGGSGNGGVGAGSFGLIRVNAAQPAIVVNADGTCRNAAGSWTTLSDARLKEHVQPIDSTKALQSLLALRGVTFEYTDAAIASHGAPDGQRTGFIAQEVEKVLPQWVSADADGIRKITEHGTTALVVEALRELDTKNQALQGENAALRAQVESLAADMVALKAALQPLLAK